MATTSLQMKINRLKEKKALYKKRVEDARKKNRPDIEKIWLDEIAVLDEEYKDLTTHQTQSKSIAEDKPVSRNISTQQLSAKDARRLRQLNNQISYIERKISIHSERGEQAAVNKQTALLNKLLQERATLTANTATRDPQTSPAKQPKTSQAKPTPRSLTPDQQKKLNSINADLTHTDKMIAEYQRFKSPKAEHWISRKYQLLSQKEAILAGNQPPSTPPPLPNKPTTPKAPSTQSAPESVSRDAIAAAQTTNNQVRVIDLEIAHADKMIREYKKHNSPKVNQWIQRKNELLARRSRITGQRSQLSAGSQGADSRKRLSVIALELAHTDKMIREYQKYNSPKANEWIEKRNDLLAEKALLEGRAAQPASHQTTSHTATSQAPQTPQGTDRNAIKAQITELNHKSKDADTKMRTSLKQGNHQQANEYLRKRNQYNEQVKQLTASLSGATAPSVNTHTTPTTPTTPTVSTTSHSSQGSTQQSTGQASTLEKSIANKYLTSRTYSNEHAYMEVIDTLLKQGQYKHLIPAKETLYDITHASKLPPAGTTINNPYIRDCFKIKVSNVRLEGYTINDTIFDTSFPNDFNSMIDRINQHVGPAPKLKYYKYLAHRDAIQLIPADRSITRYNSQFAGAKLKNITIKNISIRSKGALQGLFASDGSFENIHMENITVQTNSAHQIAILGLLSGTLDLASPNGEPIHVNLLPLRLAGGTNIYINSFSRTSSYQYGRVNSGNSNAAIADNRQKMTKRGTYYKDFNMEDFFAALRRSDSTTHILTRIKESAKMAGTLAKVIK